VSTRGWHGGVRRQRWAPLEGVILSVIRAEYRGGHRIRLTFHDNLQQTIDFLQWLDGPVFESLKDPAYFSKFFVEGGTVAWPNGADIAPETLCAHQGVAEEAA
jgi:hypothetical protein